MKIKSFFQDIMLFLQNTKISEQFKNDLQSIIYLNLSDKEKEKHYKHLKQIEEISGVQMNITDYINRHDKLIEMIS